MQNDNEKNGTAYLFPPEAIIACSKVPTKNGHDEFDFIYVVLLQVKRSGKRNNNNTERERAKKNLLELEATKVSHTFELNE